VLILAINLSGCSNSSCPRFAPTASQCVGPITCSKGSIIEISLWGVARNSRGRVASQIGLLTGLQGLTIGYMNLQGTIPSQIGRLSLLRELSVRLNEFTGILPTQLTLLTKLSHLDCSWNELSGVFPRVPSSVTYLDIRANQFVGSSRRADEHKPEATVRRCKTLRRRATASMPFRAAADRTAWVV
jgi:hypothetical protein